MRDGEFLRKKIGIQLTAYLKHLSVLTLFKNFTGITLNYLIHVIIYNAARPNCKMSALVAQTIFKLFLCQNYKNHCTFEILISKEALFQLVEYLYSVSRFILLPIRFVFNSKIPKLIISLIFNLFAYRLSVLNM